MCFRILFEKLIIFFVYIKCLSLIDCNKPKLSVISEQTSESVLNDKRIIDIKTNLTLKLKCEGIHAISWKLPEYNPITIPMTKYVSMQSICVPDQYCSSELILHDTQYWQTGQYSCYYNKLKDSFDFVYVFISDPDNLVVPVEGRVDYLVVPVLHNSTYFVIPCKPTDSRAVVSLHLYDTQIKNYIQMANSWMSFDPTIGFNVSKHNLRYNHYFDCRIKLGQFEQYIEVAVHQIKLSHMKLSPHISVVPNTVPKLGDNISLICWVNIATNTFVGIFWYFDSDNNRKSESTPISVTKQSSEMLFQTVSRSLTIFNATDSDSGVYICNVTDISGHTYSVSKLLSVGYSSLRSNAINLSSFSLYLSKGYTLIHVITIFIFK